MQDNPFEGRLEALLVGPQVNNKRLCEAIRVCAQRPDVIASLAPNPYQIKDAVSYLKDSQIGVIGLVAYPLGNLPTELKCLQTEEALKAGAKQIDITMRLESLNAADIDKAQQEAASLCELVINGGAEPGLIANLSLLAQDTRVTAGEIARSCNARLITANGMGVDTSLEDIMKLQEHFGGNLKITACGNVTNAEQALNLVDYGAERIRTPSPFKILTGLEILKRHGYQKE